MSEYVQAEIERNGARRMAWLPVGYRLGGVWLADGRWKVARRYRQRMSARQLEAIVDAASYQRRRKTGPPDRARAWHLPCW